MYQVLMYHLEDGDIPSRKQLRESFNLVAEFSSELREKDNPIAAAFHSVVDNNEFSFADASILADYAVKVIKRIENKYEPGQPMAMAPWRESVLQNANRLRQVIGGLLHLMKKQALP